MKKLCSLLLCLSLALSLSAPALAAEAVTPTPPPWCPEEEYAVFPGSAAYEPEHWKVITDIREIVRWGPVSNATLPMLKDFNALPERRSDNSFDMGVLFERALLELRLIRNNNGVKTPHDVHLSYYLEDGTSALLEGLTDQQKYVLLLWAARGVLRNYGVGEQLYAYIPYLLEFPQFTLNQLTDTEIFTAEEQETLRAEVAAGWGAYFNHIEIWLDGNELSMDVPPEARNGRTMVPIRAVAEALGADVTWVPEGQKIVLTRAGSTVTMTLDSTTATVDGQPVEMDVAPYATEGRTLIPARYVAEFFGQTVDWDGIKHQVLINEDKSVAESSNLEAWAIAMGLIRNKIDLGVASYYRDSQVRFGQFERTAQQVQNTRNSLVSAWGVQNRQDLIDLVTRMTAHGHNDSFQEAAAIANSLSDQEFAALVAASGETDKYMWPYTKQLSQRWGDKGILAWDLSRMGTLVQWGYTAGYLTYAEALELVEPAAQLTQETFTSWDEFYMNYLDGYNWWARNDVATIMAEYEARMAASSMQVPGNWETWMEQPRANFYISIKNFSQLDDTLFETGVIGLPE